MVARKLISVVAWLLGALALVLGAGAATALAASAPTISRAWSEGVIYSTAVLKAEINPEEAETTYRFEYGTSASYSTSVPVPNGSVGSGSERLTVGQSISGLIAGTTYHYRVVAANAEGTTYGSDQALTTFTHTGTESSEACPNAAYRNGPSANLSDCRAYEMVSPVEKNGADVIAHQYGGFAASVSGERITYGTRTGMGETKGSGLGGYTEFLASRGPAGWSSKGMMPTPALTDPIQAFYGLTAVRDLSPDLSRAILLAYDLPGFPGTPELEDLYLEDTVNNNVLEAVTRFEGFEEPVSYFTWGLVPELGGSSGDMSVVTFQMRPNLIPEAKGSAMKVYTLDHGHVKLLSILPDGSLPAEAELVESSNEGAAAYKDTVSIDGSRALFYATPEGGERQLYMRKNGTATVALSESEASTPTVAQSPTYLAATPDDTKVVFSTPTRLLDSDPGGEGQGLYIYTDSPHPQSESNLTFIGRIQPAPSGGSSRVVVKGISADGSHIYFMTAHDPGNETLPFKTKGTAIFLWDSGHLRQIAPEPGAVDENVLDTGQEAIASADGRRFAFKNSYMAVAGHDAVRQGQTEEMFIYDEATDELRCVSCPTTWLLRKGVRRVVVTAPVGVIVLPAGVGGSPGLAGWGSVRPLRRLFGVCGA